VRAAILESSPGDIEIRDVEMGRMGPRDVLVATKAAGLCRSDLHFLEGVNTPIDLPCVLGHEAAGVVTAVGADVSMVEPGDHVVACLSIACGSCTRCAEGRPTLCTNKPRREEALGPAVLLDGRDIRPFARIGGFSEQMLLPEQAVVAVDDAIPFECASILGCGVMTGLGAVFRTARVAPGESVAVIGCGGVGLSTIQGARIAGAAQIIAIDVSPKALALAADLGATDVVNAQQVDPVTAVSELSDGGVDHAFEVLGTAATAQRAFDMLHPGGVLTLVGVQPGGSVLQFNAIGFLREKRVQGSLMGSNHFRQDIPFYVSLYLRGLLRLDEMVSGQIRLDDLNEAYHNMKPGLLGRTVVSFAADGV
jgi:S-(hydroxymethyl)glutathione dehydrogenase / alcohol dehydrogenase